MDSIAGMHPSHVMAIFADQSHLLFYGCSASAQCKPIKAHLHTELTSSPSTLLASHRRTQQRPFHSMSRPSSTAVAALNTCSELDLCQELAVLKAQVKLKKKQLKAIAKEKKKALKQRKPKTKCESSSSLSSSSSSSSSEASDGERMPLNIKHLKKDLMLQNKEEEGVKQGVDVRDEAYGLDHIDIPEDRNEDIAQCMPLCHEPCGSSLGVERAYSYSAWQDEPRAIAGPSDGALRVGHVHGISGRIEVCGGGKCKKAGSQKLLSSFKVQIPASACVDATPCKCMGRCGAAINVRVRKEDTNPQHHSHVTVDDVGLILNHHFGIGPPLSGLPSFASHSPPTPSISTANV